MAIVYLISDGVNYKIGRTTNMPRRLRQLSTGNPHPLAIVTQVETDHPVQVEKALHRTFTANRLNKEWFWFDQQGLQRLLEVMKAIA